jgi:leucyl aminopeptidase
MEFHMQVNNTDAEGRLVLADALVYTCKLGVEKVRPLSVTLDIFIKTLNSFQDLYIFEREK